MNPDQKTDKQGYTLVEMMITITIVLLVSAMAIGFFVESYTSLFKSQAALQANYDARSFQSILLDDGRTADSFVIYPTSEDTVKEEDRVAVNDAGNYIVLAESDQGLVGTEYIRLTGYTAIKRDKDEYYDILVFDYDVPDADKRKSIDELANTAIASSNLRTVFSQVKPIGDNGLFTNVDDGNVFTFYGIRVRFPEQAQPSKIMHVTASIRG